MAWTVNQQGNFINLTPDGSTDFDWATYFPDNPEGVLIESIQIYFNAANDVINIKTNGTNGPSMFKYLTSTGDSVYKQFFGVLCKPFIKNADQTGTVTSWLIIIQTT